MSSNDSCIVYSGKGWLAGNGKLEGLLDQLIDRLAADHRGTELHPRQNVLHRLCEQLIRRLQHLERIHISFSGAVDYELSLDLARNTRAFQNRWILRLWALGEHFSGLLDLELEIGLVGGGNSAHDSRARAALDAFSAEVAFVRDRLREIDLGDFDVDLDGRAKNLESLRRRRLDDDLFRRRRLVRHLRRLLLHLDELNLLSLRLFVLAACARGCVHRG